MPEVNLRQALAPGTVLHSAGLDYRIDRALGQGTFGITYLASPLIRGSLGTVSATSVAIKEFFMRDVNSRHSATAMVSADSSEAAMYTDYKSKFLREARNLARLDHSGIVKVCDLFEANGTAYYVMELLDQSLDSFIESMPQGRVPEWTAIDIAISVARSLDYMHSVRMVHLDLKPGNIMLRGDDPVLIDFGLAKQYDPSGVARSSSEIAGGTPGYAPIEQADYHDGMGFPVTMDIYALGATLFKMLTGEPPRPASELFNYGFPADRLYRVGVSQPTIAIIAKAMQPRKGDRYRSVAEMLDALNSTIKVEVISEDDAVDFPMPVCQPTMAVDPVDTRRTQRKARRGPAEETVPTQRHPRHSGIISPKDSEESPSISMDRSRFFDSNEIIEADDDVPQRSAALKVVGLITLIAIGFAVIAWLASIS